jgi:hypothetical protein
MAAAGSTGDFAGAAVTMLKSRTRRPAFPGSIASPAKTGVPPIAKGFAPRVVRIYCRSSFALAKGRANATGTLCAVAPAALL